MCLDNDFLFFLFISVPSEQREDVAANSQSEHMNDRIQNQPEGFGDE